MLGLKENEFKPDQIPGFTPEWAESDRWLPMVQGREKQAWSRRVPSAGLQKSSPAKFQEIGLVSQFHKELAFMLKH